MRNAMPPDRSSHQNPPQPAASEYDPASLDTIIEDTKKNRMPPPTKSILGTGSAIDFISQNNDEAQTTSLPLSSTREKTRATLAGLAKAIQGAFTKVRLPRVESLPKVLQQRTQTVHSRVATRNAMLDGSALRHADLLSKNKARILHWADALKAGASAGTVLKGVTLEEARTLFKLALQLNVPRVARTLLDEMHRQDPAAIYVQGYDLFNHAAAAHAADSLKFLDEILNDAARQRNPYAMNSVHTLQRDVWFLMQSHVLPADASRAMPQDVLNTWRLLLQLAPCQRHQTPNGTNALHHLAGLRVTDSALKLQQLELLAMALDGLKQYDGIEGVYRLCSMANRSGYTPVALRISDPTIQPNDRIVELLCLYEYGGSILQSMETLSRKTEQLEQRLETTQNEEERGRLAQQIQENHQVIDRMKSYPPLATKHLQTHTPDR